MIADRAKPKLVLVVGSGLSCEAGLPTTAGLTEEFLREPTNSPIDPSHDGLVSSILTDFWTDVFGFRLGDTQPTLEDHFTVLDLAANSGHQLGAKYPPSKLRALRRMSIHRVFQILNRTHVPNCTIKNLMRHLHENFEVSVVSLNWDIVLENTLKDIGQEFYYGIDIKE